MRPFNFVFSLDFNWFYNAFTPTYLVESTQIQAVGEPFTFTPNETIV